MALGMLSRVVEEEVTILIEESPIVGGAETVLSGRSALDDSGGSTTPPRAQHPDAREGEEKRDESPTSPGPPKGAHHVQGAIDTFSWPVLRLASW